MRQVGDGGKLRSLVIMCVALAGLGLPAAGPVAAASQDLLTRGLVATRPLPDLNANGIPDLVDHEIQRIARSPFLHRALQQLALGIERAVRVTSKTDARSVAAGLERAQWCLDSRAQEVPGHAMHAVMSAALSAHDRQVAFEVYRLLARESVDYDPEPPYCD